MAERGSRGGLGRGAAGPVWAAALALACAGAGRGPDALVRLAAPPAVGWEPEGPFVLPLEVYNASGVTLALARPGPEGLEVELRREDGAAACRTPSPTHRQYESREVVRVQGASGLPLRVDLWPYCRDLSPGVYRYRAIFVANPAEAGGSLSYTGTLGPERGRVAIGPGLSRDRAALAAALSEAPPREEPLAPARPAPTEDPAGPRASAAGAAARACVDRELARRGLNAYGDPQGTSYPAGPPADEGGRILYVAGRFAGIRKACGLEGF